ncbi:hypothetical protein [Streptomyces sp. NPDC057301]|uniref:hypothetical protein n=1 Tax=Streptomyces sp. NPDC057301 TaxID=3346093 RepID=UPI003629EC9D
MGRAINTAAQKGSHITALAIARQAGWTGTFLYRDRDQLALVHAAELEPAERDRAWGGCRTSIQPDLANAQARTIRLPARIRQLESRLFQEQGEPAWRESGVGAPTDIEELQRTITRLEQRTVELTEAVQESPADLAAAREANRELTRPSTSVESSRDQDAPAHADDGWCAEVGPSRNCSPARGKGLRETVRGMTPAGWEAFTPAPPPPLNSHEHMCHTRAPIMARNDRGAV